MVDQLCFGVKYTTFFKCIKICLLNIYICFFKKKARAKYNYTASDIGEISFSPNTLIGILEADMTQQSWWFGSIWDEYRHTWSVAGSIPSNFMANA